MQKELYEGPDFNLDEYNKKYSINGKDIIRPMLSVLKELESKLPLNVNREDGEFRKFTINLLVKEYDNLPFRIIFKREITVFELLFAYIFVHNNRKSLKMNEDAEESIMKIICALVVDKADITHVNQYGNNIIKVLEIMNIESEKIINLVVEMMNEIKKNG